MEMHFNEIKNCAKFLNSSQYNKPFFSSDKHVFVKNTYRQMDVKTKQDHALYTLFSLFSSTQPFPAVFNGSLTHPVYQLCT